MRILVGREPGQVLAPYRGDQREALEAAFTPSARVLMTCCTETVVQGFRGARPDLAATLPQIFPELQREELKTSYCMNAPITLAWQNIARRLPVIANAPTPREPQTAPSKYEESALLRLSDDGDLLDPRHSDELPEGVFGYLLGSPQDEANQVAQLLLEDYLYRGSAYARSAIIVRSGTEVARFRRVLAASGIPTVTGAALVPVRDEPAVRPFLDALSLLVYARQQSADYLKLPDHNDFDGSLTENITPKLSRRRAHVLPMMKPKSLRGKA